ETERRDAPALAPHFAHSDRGIKRLLNKAVGHRTRTGRPFITLSYAQSIDGCIAARSSEPLALSGSQSLELTHRLRAAHDAILVGIGAVLADNPRLTVRLTEGKNPQPIIVDSRLRLPRTANVLRSGSGPVWVATTETADVERQRMLEAAGARVMRLSATP